MKKIFLLICLIPLINIGCGGDDDTPQPSNNVLNKELLYDKIWTIESKKVSHQFKKDGEYGDKVGTWKWVNDSDTIAITTTFTGRTLNWVINKGNTENEMEARLAGDTEWTEFRVTW